MSMMVLVGTAIFVFSTCCAASQVSKCNSDPSITEHMNNTVTRVSDEYFGTTNNPTLVQGEVSHADNQLYHGNKG